MFGGVAGAIGLACITVLSNTICQFLKQYMGGALQGYLGGDFWWFILSDVAVALICLYVWQTRETRADWDAHEQVGNYSTSLEQVDGEDGAKTYIF